MRISARADYAIRATAELAALHSEKPVRAQRIADAQHIPLKFLLNILADLGKARVVAAHRGAAGGYELARPAAQISLADVIRAVEGPLATVHETPPEELSYEGAAESLQTVWIALRASMRTVLESVSIADLVESKLAKDVIDLARQPDAWAAR